MNQVKKLLVIAIQIISILHYLTHLIREFDIVTHTLSSD